VLAEAAGEPRAAIDRALGLLLVLVVLSTPSYPWYLLMVLAQVPLGSRWLAVPALVVGSCGTLLYLQWWVPGGASWPMHLTWGLGAAAFAASAFGEAARRHPGRLRLRPA